MGQPGPEVTDLRLGRNELGNDGAQLIMDGLSSCGHDQLRLRTHAAKERALSSI